jgi:hypothetical protein
MGDIENYISAIESPIRESLEELKENISEFYSNNTSPGRDGIIYFNGSLKLMCLK